MLHLIHLGRGGLAHLCFHTVCCQCLLHACMLCIFICVCCIHVVHLPRFLPWSACTSTMLLALGVRCIADGSPGQLQQEPRLKAWSCFIKRLVSVNTCKEVYFNFDASAKAMFDFPCKHTAVFGLPGPEMDVRARCVIGDNDHQQKVIWFNELSQHALNHLKVLIFGTVDVYLAESVDLMEFLLLTCSLGNSKSLPVVVQQYSGNWSTSLASTWMISWWTPWASPMIIWTCI